MPDSKPSSPAPTPPQAARKPHRFTAQGIEIEDPYAWLRDPGYPEVKDPEILAHLEAENAYFEAVMAPQAALTETIFEELKGRIKEDDASVPAKDGAYLYHWRFAPGAQYRTWLRRPVAGGDEAVILDEPALAEGQDFFRLRALEVSPDDRLLAWSADGDGSERYVIRIKALASEAPLDEAIPNTSGSLVWAADSKTLLYVELNENLRPFRVRAHVLGSPVAEDRTLYEEADDGFFVHIGQTQSRAFLVIGAGDHVTSEVRLLPAAAPFAEAVVVAPREAGHEYDLDHAGDRLFIRTNDRHKNFRIVTAPVGSPGRDNWRELIGPGDRHYLRGLAAFQDVLVVQERIDGLDQIRIRRHADGDEHHVAFPEASYAAGLGENPEFAIDRLRLIYTSMVTPPTVYDYDLATRKLETRKVQEIPSGYDPKRYVTKRLLATARDGATVPISLVHAVDFPTDGTGALHLYGYGAYGMGMPPSFSTARLSLLDRGVAYAIAHIRGGDELGYHWYEDGKLDKRENTFKDFVDCARHLVSEGYAAEGGISISGGSAGGTLIGVAINHEPALWRAAVAHVPFVDVLNTMLDDSLPLTPMEWPEWGDPITDTAAFELIRGYSPYDQVGARAYPPLLITAGLNDPRVTYWEPAKWAAKLRATKTDDNLLLLKTNMGAGHGGKSGRYESLREVAEEYTFLLMAFGKA
ncbi:MAG: S9 family peptidase [Kiloniellales bacterium]|nr:S9 family peptidase [Kiloniellales bacterium]